MRGSIFNQGVTVNGSNAIVQKIDSIVIAAGLTTTVIANLDMTKYPAFYIIATHAGAHTSDYSVTVKRKSPWTAFEEISRLGENEATIIPMPSGLYDPRRVRVSAAYETLGSAIDVVITNVSAVSLTFSIAVMGITSPTKMTAEVYPELRCLSTDTKPTSNKDGTPLIKYQILWVVDTDEFYYWSGSEWVVKTVG